MSKPIASPSPLIAGEQPGADGAAGRAGEDAPGAGPGRLGRRGDAARGLHDRAARAGRRRSAASLEPAQVAAEQRREVGVDRRRRAALVLAEAGQDLVRGGDVDAGQLAPQVLGERPLVGRVEVGEEQADRDRLGAALADQRGEARRLASGRAARSTPSGPIRSAASKRSSRSTSGAGFGRAEPVEVGAVLAGDLEQVGEAAGRDQRRAGAAFLEQRVGADGHPVGEGLDRRRGSRRRARAPPRPRRSPRPTGRRGWSAASRCGSARRRRGRRR